ncbi:MAG: bifunctional diaminohydroxyphosphoribosylaminopyrimidine deaminase/5-amino-6-(5-phosphoribosylamino)uracil reductase RibD [Pseudomonadota bacterium]
MASTEDLQQAEDSQAWRDGYFMRRCLTLAKRAEGRTSPNPIVGCVIAGEDGRILAEGFHRCAGAPHAEAEALAKLGGKASGATLYVNLEPCAHVCSRRTEPCTPLVLESGIRRLVFGMHDPFPGHGGGLAVLARAGIAVEGPVEEQACRKANEPFLVYATEGRAHFTLKAALTLDGRIATSTGQSRWITGEAARADGHRRRRRAAAILVGAGTVVADDPLLTARGARGARGVPRGRDPVRVVLDGRLRMPEKARMLCSGSSAPTWVVTTEQASKRRERSLSEAGAEVIRLPGHGWKVDLRALGRLLAERGIISVLVEGGGETHRAFLDAGLCDRLLLYLAPKAIGGSGAPGWLGGVGVDELSSAYQFQFDSAPKRLGEDLLICATAKPR